MKDEDMVIRLPDEAGTLVTYEAGGVLAKQLGTTMLSTWAKAGAVRRLIRRNVHYYAVLDSAMLKAMTPQESLAVGIRRIPREWIKTQRAWSDKAQGETLPGAEHAGEEWDSYDAVFVLDSYNGGATCKEIAKALGRSYGAITMRLTELRRSGDLPAKGRGEPGWQWRVLALMTPEERATFLAARAPVAAAAA